MKGKWYSWTRLAVLLLVLSGLSTAPVLAQGDARITGTVRDTSGGSVSGATVVVRNEKTGAERTTTSAPDGAYIVGSLTAVAVHRAGGRRPVRADRVHRPAAAARAGTDHRPRAAAAGRDRAGDRLGGASQLDLSSARIGTNVIEREVKDLPINGRQLSQLYLQAPGSVNSGTGTFGDIRFSGRAVEQNIIRYDGIEGSAIIDASPGNLNGELPSPFRLQSSLENVQEFRVESSNYPAEYGTGTGGQITVDSKSGTNTVHGSVFEYHRGDGFDSPNYFDIAKSPLKQNQFGASVGVPLKKDRTFLFGSYEGYRLESGVNLVEAVPSAQAWARAVPAVLPLRDAFIGPGAVVLPGASTNPDFDIVQLQENVDVQEDAFSARLDHRLSTNWSVYGRYFRDSGTNTQPEGVTGRSSYITATPQNAVVALQGILSPTVLNELKVGYNAADDHNRRPRADRERHRPLADLRQPERQRGEHRHRRPGRVLRHRRARRAAARRTARQTGEARPYRPYSLSVIDALTMTRGTHNLKFGGEVRMIRLKTDRLGGTTYTFSNLNDFLANRAQSIQYLGDLSEPSVFNDGATGQRQAEQEYAIAFAQDEWRLGARRDAELRPPLRVLHAAARGARSERPVRHPERHAQAARPATCSSRTTNNFQPRVVADVVAGFRRHDGPARRRSASTSARARPRIRSSRLRAIASARRRAVEPFRSTPPCCARISSTTRTTASYQPRAYAPEYTIPERVYQYSASVQQELPGGFVATAAYVGSQGRNLFLRSWANRITEVRTNAESDGECDRHSRVRHRERQFHSAAVRRSRLQDERRPRQLQLHAAVAGAAVQLGADAQLAVHAGAQLRQHRRLERGADRRQSVRLRLRHRVQRLRRAAHVQRQRALLAARRPRPPVPGRRVRRDAGAARRVGRRRHRQRAQRAADRCPRRPSRRRLRRCGGARVLGSRRRAASRSSTRRAAARRATCGGRT